MLDRTEIDGILQESLPDAVWRLYCDRQLAEPLARFVDLVLRWNRVVSLTSLKTPEEMVRRHVAESLCCAAALPTCDSLLDLGSGAGFPGVPVQLMWPGMRVTLAESHGRKAAFLHEVVRELGLASEVFAGRAQSLAGRTFSCVSLRAVDPIAQALQAASKLAVECVCVIGSSSMRERYASGLAGWELEGARVCGGGQGGSVVYRYVRPT